MLLREAFKKSDEEVVDRYITASLKHDRLIGDSDRLEQAVTERPFNGITPIHDVSIKRFGSSPMATIMHYMFLVPEASAITREMIEQNDYFKERADFVTALGGKLSVHEVKPFGEFSGLFDDEMEIPDRLLSGRYRGATKESLTQSVIDGNVFCLKGAGWAALSPAVGLTTHALTQDVTNSLKASGVALGFLVSWLKVNEDNVHAGFDNMEMVANARALFSLAVEPVKRPKRRNIRPEAQKTNLGWGGLSPAH